MKLTHYTHDKYLASRFMVVSEDSSGVHRLYIKQVQYHRDEYWINMLYSNGVPLAEIESYLSKISKDTCDVDMDTKLREQDK